MSKLLLFIGENEKFDKDDVIDKITSINGVSNARKGNFIGAVFECEYKEGNLSTIVRLSDDLETIIVDGSGDDSLSFIVKINRLLEQPISVVDMDYSFHIELSSVYSVEDLKKSMVEL